MKKAGSLLFLFLLPVWGLLGQSNLNSLGFPSPNNSFLNSVGGGTGVGVDLYTGTAQISIPICEMASKALKIPVTLSYIGGRGIKVQDYAGSAGLGWQLNAGGSISRVVRCFPDEFANGYLGSGQWGKKIKQDFVDGIILSAADRTAVTGWDNSSLTYTGVTADGEPDLYYIKTPFFSAQFTFDENGAPVFNNESGLKITSSNFLNGNGSTNSTFIVTDAAGNTYYFGADQDKTTTTLFGSSLTFATTWYLSRIETFNSSDNITFNYITSSNNDVLNHYKWVRTYLGGCQNDDGSGPISTTVIQPRYLSSIVCPNGQIDFSYAFDRRDITTAARLTAVTLKSNSSMGITTVKSFGFNYSYFGDNPTTTDVNLLRLKLDNITLAGGTTTTATPMTYRSFSYNMSQNLPARNSQSFDFWGYYKSFAGLSNTDPMYDASIRSANGTNAQANILNGITELGGAIWNLYYEANNYLSSNTNINVGGLRVNKISKSFGTDVINTLYKYDNDAGQSTGQILTEGYNFVVVNFGGGQKILSESPINFYDLNGTFVGYSRVKTILPNGGYTVSSFQNFGDYGDIFNNVVNTSNIPTMISPISFAYKRGLLKSAISYNSADVKITEDTYSYTGLTSPISKSGWAYKSYVASVFCSGGGYTDASSSYYTNIENYRLSSSVHKDYDQITPANYVQSTTNYTYCTNKRSIRTISTTDSKNSTVTKTIYHTHDTGIPMVTTAEQNTISAMKTLNNLDAVVHEINDKNGAITQTHNSYGYIVAGSSKPFLISSSPYKGSTLLTTQNITYDIDNSNIVSYSSTGAKSSSVLYGYNNAYPIATVSNAGVLYTSSQGTGYFYGSISSSYSYSFTVDYSGTISFAGYDSYVPSGSATVSYTLVGPSNQSGNACLGGSCSSVFNISYSSMPPGNYTLSITVSGPSGTNFSLSGSYPKTIFTLNREYYFEGFEENASATSGAAHTGNKYWASGSFDVPYTLLNTRKYIIQWWNWVNGKWMFNEAVYTGPRTLTGIIDDVRIFPEDAQMSSFTYNPQFGKTGETDPSGRSSTYEFDGLARVNIIRDNDKNILSKNCYNYAGNVVSCPAATIYSNVAKSQIFTRNNCSPGYVGSQVTYNVAPGIYTSSISQADADQQAINEITLNGQNYANSNGTCTQTWYNVAKSGSFTRNNCGTGNIGSTVTYMVAAGVYSSIISQADADQKAQNDVNNNGQAYANANGTCTVSCTFSMASGYASPTSTISSGSGTVNFYLTFYPISSTMSSGTSYLIANINGGCKPSANRTINANTMDRNWQITITTFGEVYAKMINGASVTPGTTISFNNCSFAL